MPLLEETAASWFNGHRLLPDGELLQCDRCSYPSVGCYNLHGQSSEGAFAYHARQRAHLGSQYVMATRLDAPPLKSNRRLDGAPACPPMLTIPCPPSGAKAGCCRSACSSALPH